MGRTIRTENVETAKRTSDLGRLESLIEVCKKHEVQELNFEGIQIKFSDSAFYRPLNEKEFTRAMSNFESLQSSLEEQKKDYEDTLFMSAD